MDRFPQELIFAIIFGAIMLVQFLFERLRLRKRGPLSETESESGTEAWGEPDTGATDPRAVEVPQPARRAGRDRHCRDPRPVPGLPTPRHRLT